MKAPTRVGFTDAQLREKGFVPDGKGGYKRPKDAPPDPVIDIIKNLNSINIVEVPKKSKYGNKKVSVDNHKFDSKREASRYLELKAMEENSLITNLKLQVAFKLEVNDYIICRYRADFTYFDQNQNYIVEDVKGMLTPVYKLKRKLMKAILNIAIKET